MKENRKMNDIRTLIFDIEKFAVHDGPGIRTVVFMKGCPLHCLWCHNPESQSFQSELLFNAAKCSLCGSCIAVCPQKCHTLLEGRHIFDRTKCTRCGLCADSCPAEALKLSGKMMSVDEVIHEVMKDEVFYKNSGGGITLSGGEPLAHFDFTYALLREAGAKGLHTAVETCGFAPREQIENLIPLVDLWLWDIKAAPEKHEKLTGVPFEKILANLQFTAAQGGKIFLRCPLIPGVNDDDEHLRRIAEIADSSPNIVQIDLEPYHPMGEGKSRDLGRETFFSAPFAREEQKKHWLKTVSERTSKKVSIY